MPHLAAPRRGHLGRRPRHGVIPARQRGNHRVAPSASPPPPTWLYLGGRQADHVARGETLEASRGAMTYLSPRSWRRTTSRARRCVHPGRASGDPASPRAGGHRFGTADPDRDDRAAMPSTVPVGPPRNALAAGSGIHVVAPGETLHSIARHYGKPVMMLAKANNIAPNTMVKVGERIIIPGVRGPPSRPRRPPRRTGCAPRGGSRRPRPCQDPQCRDCGIAAQRACCEPRRCAARCRRLRCKSRQSRRERCRDSAGRCAAASSPASGRSPTVCRTTASISRCPKGTPVKAADDGVVAYAGNELKGYGNLVLVRHSNGFVTAYAHASELMVKRGDNGQARPGHCQVRPDRQCHLAATALRDSQRARRRSIRRNISTAPDFDNVRLRHGRQTTATDNPICRSWSALRQPLPSSVLTPSRPARSCTYCQATRPERAPRVVAHSSASRRNSSPSIGMR